jgi:F-type H+-transporting ATPase subunit gamma
MAAVRQILSRLRAITNICRITRTMEMMSTAKYKVYREKLSDTVDFYDALAQAAFLLISSPEPLKHPLLEENSSGHTALLSIGSDRGLCGSFNNRICRLVEENIRSAKERSKKVDVYVSGARLIHTLNSHNIKPAKAYTDIQEMPTDQQLDEISQFFSGEYMAGRLDFFGIIYMRFYSVTSQQAQTLTIMPLTELIDDLATRSKVIWPWDYTLEDFFLSPAADEAIEDLAKMIIRSAIQNCFMETVLSEHIARMIAMRSATKNANDMIRQLKGDYNRARQTHITAELLDIIGPTGVVHNE